MERIENRFTINIKPVGSRCNRGCEYCFIKDTTEARRQPKLMSRDIMNRAISESINGQPGQAIELFFQGGEPLLMGTEYFANTIDFAEREASRSGKVVHFVVQTNGLLIDEDWCRLFKTHGVEVGVSCDGPGDCSRLRHGNGTSDEEKLEGSLNLLGSHNIDYGVVCTVNPANQEHPEIIFDYFKNLGVPILTFIPVVERDGQGKLKKDVSVDPHKWGSFLIGVYHKWLNNLGFMGGGMQVSNINNVRKQAEGFPASSCIHAETCGNFPVLMPDGGFYSCDFFVDSGHILGNIQEASVGDMLSAKLQTEFGRSKKTSLPPSCKECHFLRICNGGCVKNRFVKDPSGGDISYLCPGDKAFFEEVVSVQRIGL